MSALPHLDHLPITRVIVDGDDDTLTADTGLGDISTGTATAYATSFTDGTTTDLSCSSLSTDGTLMISTAAIQPGTNTADIKYVIETEVTVGGNVSTSPQREGSGACIVLVRVDRGSA